VSQLTSSIACDPVVENIDSAGTDVAEEDKCAGEPVDTDWETGHACLCQARCPQHIACDVTWNHSIH